MRTIAAAILALGAMAMPLNARETNVAAAHCRLTGATGRGTSTQSIGDALQKAIANCVARGGVAACCKVGAYPVSQAR